MIKLASYCMIHKATADNNKMLDKPLNEMEAKTLEKVLENYLNGPGMLLKSYLRTPGTDL